MVMSNTGTARFGKSLLCSTLKEIFQGNKNLFDGLSISKSDYDWSPHPVIHLDFGSINHQTITQLNEELLFTLEKVAQQFAIKIKQRGDAQRFLIDLIEKLKQNNFIKEFLHKGGLRCEILSNGRINVGDIIK